LSPSIEVGIEQVLSASPTSSPVPLPPPDVRISAQSGTRLSESATIRLAAIASLGRTSANRLGPQLIDTDINTRNVNALLTYSWSVFLAEANPFLRVESGDLESIVKLPSQATVVLPASLLGPGSFEFLLTVTDTRSGVQTREIQLIEVFGAPTINAVNLFPPSGTAFNTTFNASALATGGQPPLQYQFQSSLNGILGSFSSISSLEFLLPEGNIIVTVTVRDSLGGVATAASEQLLVSPLNLTRIPNIDGGNDNPVDEQIQQQCQNLGNIIVGILNVLVRVDAISDVLPGRPLVLVSLVRQGLLNLNMRGDFELELTTSRTILLLIDRIPQISLNTMMCRQRIDFRISESLSFSVYSQQVWNEVNVAFQRALIADPGVNGTKTNVVVQDMNSIISSNASNPTTLDISQFISILNQTLNQNVFNDFVAENGLGMTAGNLISNLTQLAISLVERPILDCDAFNAALDLLDQFLRLASSRSVPLEPAFTLNTDILQAQSSNVFTRDSESYSLVGTGARVNITRLNAGETGIGLGTGVLSLSSLLSNLVTQCRLPPPGMRVVPGTTTSITTTIENETPGPGENQITIVFNAAATSLRDGCSYQDLYSCQFWDPEAQSFSTEGCATTFDGSSLVCVCDHLTQFAILENQINCRENPTEATFLFIGLSVLYIAAAIYIARTGYELKKKSSNVKGHTDIFDLAKTMFLFTQAFLSVIICLLLSTLVPGFELQYIPSPVLIILFALPHTLVWGTYTICLYQWSIICRNAEKNRLVNDMFAGRPWAVYLIMFIIVLIIFGTFGVFFYLQDTRYAILGPLVLASVTIAFSVAVRTVGQKTLNLMRTVGGRNGEQKSAIVGTYIYVLSFLLSLQSVTLVVAAMIEFENGLLLYGLLLFYVADLLMLTLQIDFLRGLKLIRMLCVLRGVIASSVWTTKNSNSSNKSTAGESREGISKVYRQPGSRSFRRGVQKSSNRDNVESKSVRDSFNNDEAKNLEQPHSPMPSTSGDLSLEDKQTEISAISGLRRQNSSNTSHSRLLSSSSIAMRQNQQHHRQKSNSSLQWSNPLANSSSKHRQSSSGSSTSAIKSNNNTTLFQNPGSSRPHGRAASHKKSLTDSSTRNKFREMKEVDSDVTAGGDSPRQTNATFLSDHL